MTSCIHQVKAVISPAEKAVAIKEIYNGEKEKELGASDHEKDDGEKGIFLS